MRQRNQERGMVIELTALLIPVLVFLTGFAIDFGVMYSVRNSAQNAADAAAIAGVYAYSLSGDPGNPAAANAPATKAASANPVFGGATVTLTSINAYRGVPCTDSVGIENYCVKVTATINSPVFFAKIFGWTPVPIQVQATAQANTGFGYSVNCAKPIFVPDPASLSPPVAVGGTMTIRPTNPTNALVPGNYYSLDFTSILNPADPSPDPVVFTDASADDNSGNLTYRDSWTKCAVTAVHCGQFINVQTGNFGNPTKTAVQTLVNSGVTTVVAPVWDPASAVKSGNTWQAKVNGFIKLTNLRVSGSDVLATYTQKLDCSAGNVGVAKGSYASPVRLIQ